MHDISGCTVHYHHRSIPTPVNVTIIDFLRQKWQTFPGSCFLIVKDLLLFLFTLTIVNEEFLGFELLAGQRKQFEEVTYFTIFEIWGKLNN